MTFAQFWPRYVAAHACGRCRAMHYVGTLAGVTMVVAGVATGRWWLLPTGVATGYACAWIGHGVFGRNRPETFGHPFYSFAADFKMLALGLSGRMRAEVARHASSRANDFAERAREPHAS